MTIGKFSIFNFQFSKYDQGFTLLEMIIAIFIFTIMMGLIVYLGFNVIGYNSFITSNIFSQNELQLTLNMLEIELRSMGPSNVGSFPIELANSNALTFYSDTDRDGLFERIRYYLNGNILMKGITKPTGSPLSYSPANEKTAEVVHFVISDPSTIFSYFAKKSIASDPPMIQPVSPSLIRAIKAQLTVKQTGRDQSGPVTFSIFATIRNFRMTQ